MCRLQIKYVRHVQKTSKDTRVDNTSPMTLQVSHWCDPVGNVILTLMHVLAKNITRLYGFSGYPFNLLILQLRKRY